MDTGLLQAGDLWKAIGEETETAGKRFLMVQLARQLLETAAPAPEAIAQMAEADTLTDHFIEYLDAAEQIHAFFQAALPRIEEGLEEFQAEIETADQNIAAVAERHRTLKTDHAALLEKREALAAESEKLAALESELAELKALEERSRPEKMAELQREVETLREKTEALRPEVETRKREKAELESALDAMGKLRAEIAAEKEKDYAELNRLSARLAETLDGEWLAADTENTRALRILKQRNIAFEKITGELSARLQELDGLTHDQQTNRELFEKHFAADAEIAQKTDAAPQNTGTDMDRLRTLSGAIRESLTEFDGILGAIIAAAEEIHGNIRTRTRAGA
jgi:DNA repair exonuclease SbcCD ATPase subunit